MSESIKVLKQYTPMAQLTGKWLRGFKWDIVGCGTFSLQVNATYAEALLKRFMERLDQKLRAPVSYVAALEHRYSGCGLSPIPAHWHFLAACPKSEGMEYQAARMWKAKYGNAKVDQYDPDGNAAFYICKLVNHPNATMVFDKLDRLDYQGPTDLMADAECDDYVPAHLKGKVYGRYLALRTEIR